ncbi:hypothetical protein CEUSTIGMA_g4397.t1 [Chlamydomonas eustigma]|uniref:RNB domain-containing protein n=1 Tax=Chlamydomonas eustigma TaxID=1157962 RepID=A0A250X2H9_9CHLO|nr:hypothetical protein CEUSTIGMA_g4397.t1 [Chlamydomonas eustigma]|eukprot:GAX76950.1 hypothetical protein CEUSTIGMA_g4397.t1 [Chlamydomonas eustigma]
MPTATGKGYCNSLLGFTPVIRTNTQIGSNAKSIGILSNSVTCVHAVPSLTCGAQNSSRSQPPSWSRRSSHDRFRNVVREATTSAANNVSSISDSTLKVGSLVEYKKDGTRYPLVLLVEPNGKSNWWGVDKNGRKQSLQPKQVTLTLPQYPQGVYKESDVTEFEEAADKADDDMLEVAWELVLESGDPISLLDMTSLLLDKQDAKSLYIMHRLLARDRLYFKQAGKAQGLLQGYQAKTASQVAETKLFIQQEEGARRDREAFASAVAASLACTSRAVQPGLEQWQNGPHAARIKALMEIAYSKEGTNSISAQTLNLAAETLQLTSSNPQANSSTGSALSMRPAATNLLTDLKLIRYHEPLEIQRFGLDLTDFPQSIVEEAQVLIKNPPLGPRTRQRLDLTHLAVYTIDDASTEEVDDGLSVERLESGERRIWIHVADPSRWLNAGSPIDLEARRRTRTLYLPWGYIPMMPKCLAKGPFSLNQGEVCCAMSISVLLSSDGSIQEFNVASTSICVTNKMTYEEVDRLLSHLDASSSGTADDLTVLVAAAASRRKYRQSHGCLEIPLPEMDIKVPYSDLDSLRPGVRVSGEQPSESPGRQLVAEMMVLAGEAIGMLGVKEGLPLPYRGQDVKVLPSREDLEAVPEGHCRAYMLRTYMTRSTVSSTPQKHSSLGLSAYVQFTSPIRRYGDLLAHYQVRAHLEGQPLPLSAADIDSIMGMSQESGRFLNALERDQENYWLSEFFRQRPDEAWSATMLGWFREESKLAAVLLDDLGWETIARVDTDIPAVPGDKLQLVLAEAKIGEIGISPHPPPRFSITAHLPSSDS